MAEKALTAVIQEISRVFDALGRSPGQSHGHEWVSKSHVSRLCEEIDGKVKACLDRPI